jgi:hypothetical protein
VWQARHKRKTKRGALRPISPDRFSCYTEAIQFNSIPFGEGMMRFFLIATVLISALAPAAFAQTDQPRAQPKMDETQDAKIKAEYLESIPYQPCPANVRFPNGRQICLGLPGNPFYRPYNAPHQ